MQRSLANGPIDDDAVMAALLARSEATGHMPDTAASSYRRL